MDCGHDACVQMWSRRLTLFTLFVPTKWMWVVALGNKRKFVAITRKHFANFPASLLSKHCLTHSTMICVQLLLFSEECTRIVLLSNSLANNSATMTPRPYRVWTL